MVAWTQPDLPLLDPLEPRVLPQDAGAWFTINRLTDDGMKQRLYRLHLIEPVLRALGRCPDTYMSQGMFAVPLRRAVHVAWLTHGYVDVDCYKSPIWQGETPDDMVQEILWFCADDDIPPPSVILSSGRGIYCKWFWTTPIPRAEAGRAVQVNRVLTRRLLSFRADPEAVDVSRILRVRGSINSKNGGQVDIVWLNGPAEAPTTYDFHAFARHILPQHATAEEPFDGPRLSVRDVRRETWATRKAWSFSREHWHWGVLEDVRRLAADRYPGGVVREGKRDLYGHVAACQLARVVPAGRLFTRSPRPRGHSCPPTTSMRQNSASTAPRCSVARREPPMASWSRSATDSGRRSTPTARPS